MVMRAFKLFCFCFNRQFKIKVILVLKHNCVTVLHQIHSFLNILNEKEK